MLASFLPWSCIVIIEKVHSDSIVPGYQLLTTSPPGTQLSLFPWWRSPAGRATVQRWCTVWWQRRWHAPRSPRTWLLLRYCRRDLLYQVPIKVDYIKERAPAADLIRHVRSLFAVVSESQAQEDVGSKNRARLSTATAVVLLQRLAHYLIGWNKR